MSDIQLDVATSIEPTPQSRTLLGDAWYDLKRNKIFWISFVLLIFVLLMVFFPGLLADESKTSSLTGGSTCRTP